MIQLNTINLTTDLRLGLNGGTVPNSSKRTAFGGYALKDLILQLDVGKGLNGRKWLDLISKTSEATINGPFTTEDGIVLESGAKVVIPVVDNIAYVEIAKKVGDTFTTEIATTLTDQTFVGSLYAVRAYSAEPSQEDRDRNALRDMYRFDGAYYFDASFDNSFE